jgi:ABC-2 type transport system ATP-binding protein
MSADAVVEFQHVHKDYPTSVLRWRNPLRAVVDVSFRIKAGEVFGLLGPNRAGKTTLVKILLSLCRPTSGQVRRFDRPQSDRSTLARIGYMHENQAFPRYWDAAGLLEYYASLAYQRQDEARKRIPKLLEKVGLADRSREPISRFSKGMVQRLGLAQALLNEPDLLVLDEPTEGLDLEGRRLLRGIIAERRNAGKSVLLVSHVLSEVEQLCNRVAVIQEGKLKRLATLDELLRTGSEGPTRSLEEALQEIYEKPRS